MKRRLLGVFVLAICMVMAAGCARSQVRPASPPPSGMPPKTVQTSAIRVTSPQPGMRISSPLKVTGSASVFEAVVSLRLVAGDGRTLADAHTNASIGAPGWGDFSTSLSFISPGRGGGWLDAYWVSPKDGSELGKVRIPIEF